MSAKYNAMARLQLVANAFIDRGIESLFVGVMKKMGYEQEDFSITVDVDNAIEVTITSDDFVPSQSMNNKFRATIDKSLSATKYFLTEIEFKRGRIDLSLSAEAETAVTGIPNAETKAGYVDPDVLADGEKAVDIISAELKSYTPDKFVAWCAISNVIYKNSGLTIMLAAVPVAEAKSNNVALMNSNHAKFSMGFLNNSARPMHLGDKFEIDMLMGNGFKRNGIIWRKISGKSPSECAKKFVMWIKKNEAAIKALAGK